MSSSEIDTIWQSVFPNSNRPELYCKPTNHVSKFQPISDPQSFLQDLSILTSSQLYALSANNQIALQLAQDEYLELERIVATIRDKDSIKNPQVLLDDQSFEERKESILYGYKLDLPKAHRTGLRAHDELEKEKYDIRPPPDPFVLGGFIPNDKQQKILNTKLKTTDSAIIDGWEPVMKDGRKLYPRQQLEYKEYDPIKVKPLPPDLRIRLRHGSEDFSADAQDDLENKHLTRTRFGGKKYPPTRDPSEAPSSISTPKGKRSFTPKLDVDEIGPITKKQKTNGSKSKPSTPKQRATPSPNAIIVKPVSRKNSADLLMIPQLSPNSLRARKWTGDELIEQVKRNHDWLNDDPEKARRWKDKILEGNNPVRTYSMFKKWGFWKDNKLDKRPRAKKEKEMIVV